MKTTDNITNLPLIEYARRICDYSPSWKASECPSPSWVKITLENGASFDLRNVGDCRFHVRGNWPVSKVSGQTFTPNDLCNSDREGTGYTTINFDGKKSPEAAQREIARRFLPGFLVMREKLTQRITDNDNYIRGANRVAAEVARVLGVQPHSNAHAVKRFEVVAYDSVYFKAECTQDGASVTLGHMTEAQVIELAKLVASWK